MVPPSDCGTQGAEPDQATGAAGHGAAIVPTLPGHAGLPGAAVSPAARVTDADSLLAGPARVALDAAARVVHAGTVQA